MCLNLLILLGKVEAWRRERDSNPRKDCSFTGLANLRFRPLSHLSKPNCPPRTKREEGRYANPSKLQDRIGGGRQIIWFHAGHKNGADRVGWKPRLSALTTQPPAAGWAPAGSVFPASGGTGRSGPHSDARRLRGTRPANAIARSTRKPRR